MMNALLNSIIISLFALLGIIILGNAFLGCAVKKGC